MITLALDRPGPAQTCRSAGLTSVGGVKAIPAGPATRPRHLPATPAASPSAYLTNLSDDEDVRWMDVESRP